MLGNSDAPPLLCWETPVSTLSPPHSLTCRTDPCSPGRSRRGSPTRTIRRPGFRGVGDMVKVTKINVNGQWEGECKGKRAIFPSHTSNCWTSKTQRRN
ncbi:hypothetical protein F7725_021195 [Dissostichus mawsoni]|uniref:Uncharacterized protein n=1 Tax=Dissostichus mawsoni TaxID=36200 RepID=A0A7J5YI45_DISMA|nr:hypothetical protein F7725_021195 [Dissostichus mawsoni]